MKKRIVIVLAILIAVGSYLALGSFTAIPSPLSLQTMSSNTCVLSAGNIYISSNIQELDGKKGWIISGMSGDCAEKIIGGSGKIPSEAVKGKNGEKNAKRDFSIFTSNKKGWWKYDLNKDKDFWYPKYDISDCGLGDCSNKIEKCKNKDGYITHKRWGPPLNHAVVCFWKSKDNGDKFNIGSGEEDFKMDVKTCTSSECTTSATVTGDDKEAVLDVYGDKKASFTVLGSVDLEENPKPTNYYALKWDITGDYRLIDQSDWQTYEERMSSGWIEDCLGNLQPVGAEDTIHNCYTSVTSAYFDASKDEMSEWQRNYDKRMSIGEDEMKIYSGSEDFVKPLFQVKASVDWIGVEVLASNPEINYKEATKVYPSDSGLVKVDVKNTASVTGQVQVGLDCDYPLNGESVTQSIQAGDVERFRIPVSTASSNEGNYNCDITAQDVEWGSKKDTDSISVELDTKGDGGGVQCTSHQYKRCFGNNVYWYDSCGNREQMVEQCTVNELCRSGKCTPEGKPGGGPTWKLWAIIAIAAGVGYVGYKKYYGDW